MALMSVLSLLALKAIEDPWVSASINKTFLPSRAAHTARLQAIVVLPTPPLVFPIVIIISKLVTN